MRISPLCRLAGTCLQGLGLGALLLLAILQLASSEVGAQVFRYQGF